MNDKPQVQTEVALDFASKIDGVIRFYGSPDAADEIAEFGKIEQPTWGSKTLYRLIVDKRYDFEQVLKYIEGYG